MIKIKDIIKVIEEFAPINYQESFDNSGLVVGDVNKEIDKALLTLDVTEEVVDEAIGIGANIIISHHPVIFSGLKKITGGNMVEKIVLKAIKNDIALYSAHTNIDSVVGGVNSKICQILGLENCKVLDPTSVKLKKITTYVPEDNAEKLRSALFEAGAGHIGNYNSCSFNSEGYGTFKALENSNPYVGQLNELHKEKEIKVETVFPEFIQGKIISALMENHPYEEPAFDIYTLDNKINNVGIGMFGCLPKKVDAKDFLLSLKDKFNVPCIKHTKIIKDKIQKVAVCGGSGSYLLRNAKSVKADIFISGDFKYHQFFEAENKIIIADIGHFESEQFTIDIFYDILTKKIANFVVCKSQIETNPIKYL